MLNLGCGAVCHPDWMNIDLKPAGAGIIAYDLSSGLPIEGNSLDVIYHSHLLEHFPKNYAPEFMKHCFSVLKSGGIIRVVVPDLEMIVRCYVAFLKGALEGDLEAQNKYEWIMLELLDQLVRNTSGGEMLAYWHRNPMPAEDFVIARLGSEVLGAIQNIRQQSAPNRKKPALAHSPEEIGHFRLAGEIHQWMYDRYSLGKLMKDAGFTAVEVCRANESAIPGFNNYHLDITTVGAVRKPDSLFMEGRKPQRASDKINSGFTSVPSDR